MVIGDIDSVTKGLYFGDLYHYTLLSFCYILANNKDVL